MDSSPTEISLQRYQQISKERQETIRSLGRYWNLLSYIRGGLFLLSVVIVVLGFLYVFGVRDPWFWLGGLLFLGFLVVAAIHSNIEIALNSARIKLHSAKRSISRIQRDWNSLPSSETSPPDHVKNVSKDLDLFGNESLFQLIGTVYTPKGIEYLRDWIADGADVETVVERQQAVEELKPHDTWRDEFELDCEYLGGSPSGPAEFVAWAEGPNWLSDRPWILWSGRILASATAVSMLLLFTRILPIEIAGPCVLASIAGCFLWSVIYAGRIHQIFNSVWSKKKETDVYAKLFRDIQKFDATSPLLMHLRDEIVNPKHSAPARLNKLEKIISLADLRRQGIGFLLYLFLQFCFCWDVHILHLLEGWKKKNEPFPRKWFDSLGMWECLCALGKLAADNPQWTFPEFKTYPIDELKITATQLGHPLIDQSRVCNDVTVGPPGSVLLVTGSNMSGKSTLLRSIGVNVVLAQMGSVVCADAMTCSPIRIESSMRIHDHLASGVSFFMAELNRLKEVVDTANDQEANRPMLFLLDEILQGTNSAERHIAVTQVVRSLIRGKAIGAISTHDLELANPKSLGGHCHTVHFREKFFERDGKEVMEFDYIMREGVSPTTNALKLLRLVGIELSDDG